MKNFTLRNFLLSIVLIFSTVFGLAQTTNVTATITDSDGQAWVNGSWSASLYNPSGTQRPVYRKTGQPVAVSLSGSLNSSGAMSYAVPDNLQIDPAGTQWIFTFCSITSAPCSVMKNQTVTGTSEDFSSSFSGQVTTPRFTAIAGTYGYLDVEAQNPVKGSTYFNVVSNAQRTYNGTTWVNSGNSYCDGSGNCTFNTTTTSINSVVNVKSIPSSLGGSNALGNGARLFLPFSNGPITAGSSILTCVSGGSTCTFSSSDVGKLICLGPAIAVQTTPNEELCTTIGAVNSSTQITLATPVPSGWTIPTSNYLEIVYASDDSAAINNVLHTYHGQMGANNQAQIFLPCGIYGLSQSLTISNQLSLRGASRDCVILWYMGTNPSSVAPASGVQPVSYAVDVQGSSGIGVPSVSDLTIYGNTSVQETVLDTVGTSTFSNVWIDGSTDYALQLWTVAWSGYNVVLQNGGNSAITSSPNGMYLGGYPNAGGPNSCTSCTIAQHSGIGLYVGKSAISMYSMQESGNIQNIFVEVGGRLHLYDGLVEYVGGTGTDGLVTAYGIIESMGGTSIGDPVHFGAGSIFYESTGSSFTGVSSTVGFTFDGSGAGTGYTTASAVPTTSLYPSATCTGVTVNLTASSGAITNATVASGGSGCKAGDFITPTQSGASGGVIEVTAVSSGAATSLLIISNDAQYYIINGARLSYSPLFDHTRCGQILESPSIGSTPATGWFSYQSCNNWTGADAYAIVYGDWNLAGTCTTWNTSSCATYPLEPKALNNASAQWRAVFHGQWTLSNGTMLTTVPETLELSSTSNTADLGSLNTVTVVEDNSTANQKSYPNQLVMYANNPNLQFTGTVEIWPNTTSTQPSVSYQNVQAQAFETQTGATSAPTTGSPVTLFTMPSGAINTYIVSASISSVTNNSAAYAAEAIIMCDGTTATVMQQTNGASLTLSLSGLAIQGTQSSGGSSQIAWSVIRLK